MFCTGRKTIAGPCRSGCTRLDWGLAESEDGVHFTRRPEPVFYPAEDSQKSPRMPGGLKTRVSSSLRTAVTFSRTRSGIAQTYTIGVATSRDLIHWTKHGRRRSGDTGPYAEPDVQVRRDCDVGWIMDASLRARIRGKFWMYWGEIQVRVATSLDLIHWTHGGRCFGETGWSCWNAVRGSFDSGFPEVGTPPILTKRGILVLYNGKNAEAGRSLILIWERGLTRSGRRCSIQAIPRGC